MSTDSVDGGKGSPASTLEGVAAAFSGNSVPPGGVIDVHEFNNEADFHLWLSGFEFHAEREGGTDASRVIECCLALRNAANLSSPNVARAGFLLAQFHAQMVRPHAERYTEELPASLGQKVIDAILAQDPEADFRTVMETIMSRVGRSLYGLHITLDVHDRICFNGRVVADSTLRTYHSRRRKKEF